MDLLPALLPERAPVAGRLVTLEPLKTERHSDDLWLALSGEENDCLWLYLPEDPSGNVRLSDTWNIKQVTDLIS